MKTNTTLKKIFQQERDSITVPSRSEFRNLLDHVTKKTYDRNTQQKGTKSPFGMLLKIPRNSIVASMIALVVIVIVMIPRKSLIMQMSTNKPAPIHTIQSTSEIDTITDSIISDIMNDLYAENVLIDQDLATEQSIENDNDILDTLII